MRKNFGAKPLTYPQPVYIIATYGEDGTPDAMNAAWGGISEQNEISLCLSAGHKTVKNILKRGAFTVSMAEAGHITACDYVGLVSGNNTPDKFTKAGFHAVMSEFVDAPLIEELSVAVECRLKDYNPETCILRGEIVNVSVDERVLTPEGKVDPAKVSPRLFGRTPPQIIGSTDALRKRLTLPGQSFLLRRSFMEAMKAELMIPVGMASMAMPTKLMKAQRMRPMGVTG